MAENLAYKQEWRMKPEERSAIVTQFRCSLFNDLIIQVDDVFDRVTKTAVG